MMIMTMMMMIMRQVLGSRGRGEWVAIPRCGESHLYFSSSSSYNCAFSSPLPPSTVSFPPTTVPSDPHPPPSPTILLLLLQLNILPLLLLHIPIVLIVQLSTLILQLYNYHPASTSVVKVHCTSKHFEAYFFSSTVKLYLHPSSMLSTTIKAIHIPPLELSNATKRHPILQTMASLT